MTNSRIRNRIHRRFSAIREERAQGLVELCLMVPVLSVLLLGTAEVARVAYASIEVSNAARAAVQYGAQDSTTAADTTGMQTAATDDADNLAAVTANETTYYVCSNTTSWSGTNLSTSKPTCSNGTVKTVLEVDTQASIDPMIHLWGLPTAYTIKGRAIQECLLC